jgi:hypothetical protein
MKYILRHYWHLILMLFVSTVFAMMALFFGIAAGTWLVLRIVGAIHVLSWPFWAYCLTASCLIAVSACVSFVRFLIRDEQSTPRSNGRPNC